MKTILTCLLGLLFPALFLCAQSLYKVSMEEKVQHASLIVEGTVVDQKSFWNPQHTMIFTANKIEVSKIFKGSLQDTTVEILTQGGTVGSENIQTSDLLVLSKDQAGIFFCMPNAINLRMPKSKKTLYDVYSSAQGFLKYNLATNTAAAPFEEYKDIANRLYPELMKKTGLSLKNINPGFPVTKPSYKVENINAVTISSFSPATVTAGALLDPANNVLTITGSGFGTASGMAAVLFDDANDGPAGNFSGLTYDDPLVISWTDTEIKVRVPSDAGTGSIIIQDALGNYAASSSQLTVLYSILNVTFDVGGIPYTKESNLMNTNGGGGYTILYSTNTAGSGLDFNGSTAKQTFQRALSTWKEVSGYNVTEGGPTTIQSIADDGNNVIMFDNANTGTGPLPAGTLGVCYSFNSMCGADLANYQAQKTGFDVVIRNTGYSAGTIAFTLGPCPPNASSYSEVDLETVLLHELGHSLNLGHIIDGLQGPSVGTINPGKLMHYAVSNSVRRTTPDYSAKAGASYAINPQGNLYGSCGLYPGEMTPIAITSESKDECPASFPSTSTPQNTTVSFDLAHATSNKFVDPAYTQIRCDGTGASQTNNAYYAFKTSNAGSLLLTVSGYNTAPSALTGCTQKYSGVPVTGVRLAIYQANSCPGAGSFPTPLGCATINGNGSLSPVPGLAANNNYLLYAEGIENTKASFSLTFGGSLLPLRFTNFSGQAFTSYNQLSWKTEDVVNVEKLVIQKSTNGTNFENAGGVINLNEILDGTFRDNLPYSETFYRLAIVNADRSLNYSSIISLKRATRDLVTVYPNPAKDHFSIQLNSIGNDYWKFQLYNSVGQLVRQKNLVNSQTILPARGFAPGLYQLVVYKNNVKIESHNLVVQ